MKRAASSATRACRPNRPVHESFEIPFPVEDVKKDDKMVRTILDYDMTVDVELMYLPFGSKESGAFTWQKVTKEGEHRKRRGVASGPPSLCNGCTMPAGRNLPPPFPLAFFPASGSVKTSTHLLLSIS